MLPEKISARMTHIFPSIIESFEGRLLVRQVKITPGSVHHIGANLSRFGTGWHVHTVVWPVVPFTAINVEPI